VKPYSTSTLVEQNTEWEHSPNLRTAPSSTPAECKAVCLAEPEAKCCVHHGAVCYLKRDYACTAAKRISSDGRVGITKGGKCSGRQRRRVALCCAVLILSGENIARPLGTGPFLIPPCEV